MKSPNDEFNSDEAAVSKPPSAPAPEVTAGEIPPSADASGTMTVKWEAAISADVEPWHTLKLPKAEASGNGDTSPDQTVPPRQPIGDAKPTDGAECREEQTIQLKRLVVESPDADVDPATSTDVDYQMQVLLGQGGMGAVYAARQQSMDRLVAVKVLSRELSQSEESRQAFVSEAIITGRLDHPNIVPIYDVGKQSDDAPFYSKRVFQENNLPDVEVRGSQSSPQLTASGKFHEILPLT